MRQFPWGQSINGIKMIEEKINFEENFSLQTIMPMCTFCGEKV